MIKSCFLVFLFLFLAVTLPASARCGGSCGGGGNIIQFPNNENAFLLDRLSLNPDLAYKTHGQKQINQSIEKVAKKIEPLRPEDHGAFELAFFRLDSWLSKLTPREAPATALLQLVKNSLNQMTYIRTSHRFNLIERYKLPEHLKKLNPLIKTVILFIPAYGAIISSSSWDRLDIETQAGLLVHEALRQIQEAYKFNDLTDEQLQLITAQIMDGEPNPNFNFEYWMSPMLARFCYLYNLAQITGDPLLTLAVSINVELNTIVDNNQRNRMHQFSQETPENMLQGLIERGFIKE